MRVSDAFGRLKVLLGEIYDLERVGSLLSWDQETMMPAEGALARAEQRATIGRAAHERLVSDELGRLLEELRGEEESLPYESDEASLIRVARRDHEKARRVPAELRGEILREGALGIGAWLEARAENDFEVLRPQLGRHAARLLVVAARDADQAGLVGVVRKRLLLGAELVEQLPQLVGDEPLVGGAADRRPLLGPGRRARGGHHRLLVPRQERRDPLQVVDLADQGLEPRQTAAHAPDSNPSAPGQRRRRRSRQSPAPPEGGIASDAFTRPPC